MAWPPTLPAEPRGDRWWNDVWIYQQEAAVADARRAERIEQLHRRCHELDMKLAGVLSADRWRRIQRRGEQRSAGSHGYESELWRGLPVEHSAAPGRILSVR